MLSSFSRVQLFATHWIAAHQAPLSMGFSRQEYWTGLPCSPLGDLPLPGIEPKSLMAPALAGGFFTTRASWEAPPCIDLPAKIPIYKKSPTFWAPGTSFVEDNFSMDWGSRGWFGDDSSIYCTVYFHYYFISSTSDHQALDPESWGPLLYTMPPFYSVTHFPFIRNHKPPTTSLQGYGQ